MTTTNAKFNHGFKIWGVRIIKFFITLMLLLVVFTRINFEQLLTQTEKLSWFYLLLAIAATIVQTFILSWRWHRVVNILGGRLGLGLASRLSFQGVFMNQVLPTSIGGDVFRVWGLHRHGVANSVGFTSVVIDRVTGLFSLSLLVTLSSVFVWDGLVDQSLRWVILCSSPMILGIILCCAVVDQNRLRFLNHHLIKLVAELATGMRKLAGNLSWVIEILLLGALASLVGIIAAIVLGKGLGIDLGLFMGVVMIGSVTLITALPVSLGGWGVREASMISLLGIVGIQSEKALLLSVLYGVVMMLASLPGGIVWWWDAYGVRKLGERHSELLNPDQIKNPFSDQLLKTKLFKVIARLNLIPTGMSNIGSWLYMIFLLGVVSSVAYVGPIVGDDTDSYENHWPTRSPVYPRLLDIFNGHYQLVVIFQIIFGVMSILFFCKRLCSILQLSLLNQLVITFLLFIPYFPLGWLGVANFIGTDSISYALFLVTTGYFVSGVSTGSRKEIVLSCLILAVLLLTRKQFLFVVPVYVILVLINRKNLPKYISLIGIVLIGYLSSNIIERVYNGISTGHYTGVPFTGIQAVVRPLWIANSDDAESMTGIEKDIFISTMKLMQERKVSLESCKQSSLPIQCGYHHFLESYNIICWGILYPTLRSYGVTDWWEIDKITLSISSKIFMNHTFSYIAEYYSALKNGDGLYYMMLLMVVFFWALGDCFLHGSIKSRLILLITMMSLSNILMVSIVEPLLIRYTFYTSFLQISLFFILITNRENSDVRNNG